MGNKNSKKIDHHQIKNIKSYTQKPQTERHEKSEKEVIMAKLEIVVIKNLTEHKGRRKVNTES